MKAKGTLVGAEEVAPWTMRSEKYDKGWNDRKFQDFSIIEEALRQSTNFTEFLRILREKITELDRNMGQWQGALLQFPDSRSGDTALHWFFRCIITGITI